MLIISSSHLFHRALNVQSFILSPYSTISTLLILAACSTRINYETRQFLASFSVAQWIERPPGVWEVIGSNPVGDSDVFFVPHS